MLHKEKANSDQPTKLDPVGLNLREVAERSNAADCKSAKGCLVFRGFESRPLGTNNKPHLVAVTTNRA